MFKITDVAKHLLIINIILFLASQVFGLDMLALHYPGSSKFEPYQLVTYFFMHANFMHILFNMFALVMFGSALEMTWGPKRFLFYYIACALGAAALHILMIYWDVSHLQQAIETFQANPNYDTFWAYFRKVPFDNLNPEFKEGMLQLGEALRQGQLEVVPQALQAMGQYVQFQMDIPMVGASGAIFGLLLAFVFKFPNAELILFPIPIPVKAKYYVPVLMVLELFLGVNNFSWDNVAHFAHLGGAITGLILILFGRYFGKSF